MPWKFKYLVCLFYSYFKEHTVLGSDIVCVLLTIFLINFFKELREDYELFLKSFILN